MIDFEKILSLKGKSKAELSRFLEITPNNVNRVIRNPRITFSQIENICKFCEISVIDALRVSGYNDADGLDLSTAQYANMIADLSEPLSKALLDMFKAGEIYPACVLKEKDREIERLNREIGRLIGENKI